MACENVSDRFLGDLQDQEESASLVGQEDHDPNPCPYGSPQGHASFGLSQGILIPGLKHLMHNTQDDMLATLRHYTWYTATRLFNVAISC